jgi:hypothetical protein
MTTSTQPLGLRNAFVRLTRDKRLRLVVVGNSVTNGSPDDLNGAPNPSFYVALGNWFRENFPAAQIEVIPKIIFATGPEVQVFRMDERVTVEKPDLVLVEFNAANAAWGVKGRHITEPASEGYFRRLRMVMREVDCLVEMAFYEKMLEDYRAGKEPISAAFQKTLAGHYGCVHADAGSELARRLLAGEAFSTYMDDGIHPSVAGYQIYSNVLIREVERQWQLFQQLPESEKVIRPHPVPAKMIDPDPWIYPRFVPAEEATLDDSFKIESCGKVRFAVSDRPHAAGFYQPKAPGRVAGYLMRDMGKGGQLEVRVDGKWIRLFDEGGPRFTHGDDPGNRFYRDFFGSYPIPQYLEKFEFRISADPKAEGITHVEIIGFFVLERPAISVAPAPNSDKAGK